MLQINELQIEKNNTEKEGFGQVQIPNPLPVNILSSYPVMSKRLCRPHVIQVFPKSYKIFPFDGHNLGTAIIHCF